MATLDTQDDIGAALAPYGFLAFVDAYTVERDS